MLKTGKRRSREGEDDSRTVVEAAMWEVAVADRWAGEERAGEERSVVRRGLVVTS